MWKRIFATLALAAALTAAGPSPAPLAAEPAAPWPEEAQGRSLPRPSWVLVIPARRKLNGDLSIWERSDEWTKAWRVPRTLGGVRMVTLLGDSEDRRSVTAAAIDGMLVDSLAVVMRKYGAPALALAVTDGRSVALAGYVPGYAASWLPSVTGNDMEDTRNKSLSTLASLFGGSASPAAPSDEPAAMAKSRDAEILAMRDRDDGGMDFRVRMRMPEAEAREALGNVAGVNVETVDPSGSDSVAIVSTSRSYEGLVSALRSSGLNVR